MRNESVREEEGNTAGNVLEGREASNAILLTNRAVSIGVDLGDDDTLLVLEGSAEHLPVRGEVLAVAA